MKRILLLLLMLVAPLGAPAVAVDHARIVAADSEPGNWLSHGRTYDEQRFSPLRQINADNVAGLGLAWHFDTNSNRGLEATPIVVDGVMYVTGTWSVVYALDARSGELIWKYDPAVPREVALAMCCDVVNRGVAIWGDKVFVGTLDGRLVALDMHSGEVVWETMTVNPDEPYTITGAPRVVKGKVLIGNGGAEYGVRGYVGAYDADSGELVWRFYTVPGDPALGFENEAMARAAETWSGEWWQLGGGGTVWDSMSYDPELDLLYVGVGNGSPWNRRLRSPGGGDNLYLSSIVALRPDTGEYVWHYQVVPAETWDYTATQHIILADIIWRGEERKVLMQAPKSGFFMILDRETGELLSAEPYVDVTWATHYDMETGRPVEAPGQDYAGGTANVKPSGAGGHNWQPMAFHPETGLVYIPAMEATFVYTDLEQMPHQPGFRHTGVDRSEAPPGDELFFRLLQKQVASGHLLAWDPVRQREAWRVELPVPWNGGVLATAGNLVFHGGGDAQFSAYDASTGSRLWSYATQAGIIAAPATYTVDGEQYVTVLAGWGGAFGLMSGIKPPPGPKRSRILTFKLGGQDVLPPVPERVPFPEPPPKMEVDHAFVERGEALYSSYCSFCHGVAAISADTVPDLRRLEQPVHDSFQLIVHGGAFKGLGMPGFSDVLSEEDVDSIHAYVIEKAHEDKALRESSDWWLAVKRFFYSIVAWIVGQLLGGGAHSA